MQLIGIHFSGVSNASCLLTSPSSTYQKSAVIIFLFPKAIDLTALASQVFEALKLVGMQESTGLTMLKWKKTGKSDESRYMPVWVINALVF